MSTTLADSTTLTQEKVLPKDHPAPAETSLWVGDLAPEATEEELTKVFSQAGPLTHARICVSKVTGVPRGYGYVSFATVEAAKIALKEFNHWTIAGKPCRVMQSLRGQPKFGAAEANIFVKNIPSSLSPVAFHDTFATFGEIVSSRLGFDSEKKASLGFGYIQYAKPEQAQAAIAWTDGSTLDIEQASSDEPITPLRVSLFVKKAKRQNSRPFFNVFFKNLPLDSTLESFTATYSKFGAVTSAVLHTSEDGKPTGTGFINFEEAKIAAAVVKSTEKNAPEEPRAMRAFSKTERQAHHQKAEQSKKGTPSPAPSA